MLCPRQGANCCYIDNVKLLQDLIKKLVELVVLVVLVMLVMLVVLPNCLILSKDDLLNFKND